MIRGQTAQEVAKFRLLITAEDLADVEEPSQQVVLSTEMFRVKKGWW
ncbi:MAG: hypothetical protein ETSY2_40570 [Candidatus Entotheonella gemina]|uniref:Uncharacterized protein n=1 Tax=Candidatus Entotheonella gemina TaxID=1429439 RepID=W4LP07_9BACT|nr:MAG: hypothetical protein ETSY2_40570 [Candidatus Entotheonella gemina]